MPSKAIMKLLREGTMPPVVVAAAAMEGMAAEALAEQVLAGTAVIPAAISDREVRATAIGGGLRTKVNANIGSSSEAVDAGNEKMKLEAAVAAGADAVMDLSSAGDLVSMRGMLMAACDLPFGTVPVYEAAATARESEGSVIDLDRAGLFEAVRRQAVEGVDFMTVHAGLTRAALDELQAEGRLMDVVSRGGAFMIAMMLHRDCENPFYQDFDLLLEILLERDVTLSLGDGLRPGCIADATDRAQIHELMTLGRLARRAQAAGVQVMIEGPGHVPLQDIEVNVRLAKELTGDAPFYVLGPLVTDVAPGYDHITAAIGGAVAGAAGADFLCYVTSAEHLGLPRVSDVREGVMASRIAAHAADVAKGISGAADWDRQMAQARKSLDWEAQINLAVDPERARAIYRERQSEGVEGCSMCGELCAMKIVSDHLGVKAGEISGC
ncbi:phosphomethylpyrimidine synthase [bacterium BMS3Abin01]|nr:phosphomethylpyrimidine synthase [bacterium BMS3Abin01]